VNRAAVSHFSLPRSRQRSALAATINRFVDKNGTISSFNPPPDAQPVHYLRGLLFGEKSGVVPVQGSPQFCTQLLGNGQYPPPLQNMLTVSCLEFAFYVFVVPVHATWSFLESQGPGGALPSGGQQLILRSLSSARLPYPALLLGRNAWTAVDLLYSLPGVPMTFGEEHAGRAYRVDVTGTYTHNASYLDNEKKKRDNRIQAQVRR
jgi:hypothetical protein